MKSIATGKVSEPVRLLAGGGTAYERRLLESAELDVMPSATPARLAEALAVPGVLGARGALARLRGRRWLRLGGLSGLGGLGLAALLAGRAAPPPSSAVVTSMPVASAPSAAEPLPSRLVEPAAVPEPAVATPPPSPRAAPAGAPRRARPEPAQQQPARGSARSTARDGGLLDEVRLLESARAALRAGDHAAARRSLEEYRARFEHGELGFEADLLEAERASSAGERGRARALAEALLARPGAARYRERLERLLKRTPPAAQNLGSDAADMHMDGRRSNP